MREPWQVPPIWEDETAVIIGGGPSLTLEQIDYVRGKAKLIAINNSYMVCPDCDLFYFCDCRWYQWHKNRPEFKKFISREDLIIVTLDNLKWIPENFKSVMNRGRTGLCHYKDGVHTGSNSGFQCINLCYHLGVKKIILLGIDMQYVDGKSHWHGSHTDETGKKMVTVGLKSYEVNMIPKFETLVEPLKEVGIEVFNCSPTSALKCFDNKPLEEVI
ncbi:MAG: hypothetical protein ACXABY_22580 [Candidatus Thorarchaeota archaeon]|jgi:hypothetical protein